MTSAVLATTQELSHEDWLQERKKGVGGSDAAAIAGLNKWKSPVSVYMDKTGQSPEEETNSEAAYFGNVLEEVVAREFMQRTGKRVRKRNAILRHPEHPFILANVDRLIIGEKTGLECKTASEYLKGEWKDDEIPSPYLLQCQHYMAVTGYNAWWIAVLIGGNKFIYKKVNRDEELIDHLIGIEKEFWEDHVLKLNPPAFDGSDASTNLLQAMYPESEPESETELPNEAGVLLGALEEMKAEKDDLSTRIKEYENQLKNMLGDFEKGYAGHHIVTWKSHVRRTIDSKRLKAEKPEVYEQYTKESTARPFKHKEVQ
jgi:putative phage-type endonuclease